MILGLNTILLLFNWYDNKKDVAVKIEDMEI